MRKKTFKLLIFLLYLLILGAVLFLRQSDGLGVSIDAVLLRLRENINFIPLNTIKRYYKAYTDGMISPMTYYLNIYGNILLFLPMGAGLSQILHSKFVRFITLMFMIVSAELIQLLFGIGRLDIDDVILNLIGAVFPILFMKKR